MIARPERPQRWVAARGPARSSTGVACPYSWPVHAGSRGFPRSTGTVKVAGPSGPAPATRERTSGDRGRHPFRLVPRRPAMHPLTRRNLLDALRDEALSAARLQAYAGRAEAEGRPDAARTFRQLAAVDTGHARDILDLLGWVSELRGNVLAQLLGDSTVHGLRYPRSAADARRAGDRTAARLFERLAADETEAALLLMTLLDGNPTREEVRDHDTSQAPTPPAPRAPARDAQAALLAPVLRAHASGGAQGRPPRAVRAPVAPRAVRAAAGSPASSRS